MPPNLLCAVYLTVYTPVCLCVKHYIAGTSSKSSFLVNLLLHMSVAANDRTIGGGRGHVSQRPLATSSLLCYLCVDL